MSLIKLDKEENKINRTLELHLNALVETIKQHDKMLLQ